MGNTQSNRNPSSMSQCFDPVTHEFSLDSYFRLKREREIEKQEDDFFYETSIELLTQSPEKQKRRRRTSWERNLKIYRCPVDNKLKACPLTETSWYQIYIENPDLDSDRFHKKFRRRFRMRYSSFRRHMVEVKQSSFFKQWTTGSCDAAGNASTPIELLVLGVLRYLGRAVTFDDLEEHTGISEETHRRFFHIYVEFGSTSFFQKYVQLPSDNDIESSSKEYFVAGLPGKFVLNMVLY